MSRAVKTCEKCGNDIRNFHINNGEFLCYKCFRSTIHEMPQVSIKEPLIKSHVIYLNLTERDNKSLIKRLRYLYPNNFSIKRLKLCDYVRKLIISDLENWKEVKR